MELIATKYFQKRLKKLTQNKKQGLKKKIDDCLLDFSAHGMKSKYFRHDLKGKHKELSELQIGGDVRIIIKIVYIHDLAYLLDIGTHSQLKL